MIQSQLLQQVQKSVLKCKKCRLCETAINAVPGEGNPNAEIVFVGEAPGANEDKTGRPFVGRAGRLLEKLLEEINLQREDVWIGNIIKHRPPQNRDPLQDEIDACAPFLEMQLKAIDPIVIVTLGRFAMNFFYKQGKITNDHGHPKRINDRIVYPVYHPAAALRNSNFAKVLREDFHRIPKVVEYAKKKYGSGEQQNNEINETQKGQIGFGL